MELNKEDKFIELTIVGSMALYLNGLNFTRMTEDIDYINYEAMELFKVITTKIAKQDSSDIQKYKEFLKDELS